uniref:X8 domain-containing protein n=1 Tax=Kalanchoe fedtschenkoi TaxID=63787 RepID=A0A7N0VA27_KALFE
MKFIIITLLLISISMTLSANLSATKGGTWCVAKPSASDEELVNNIKYVCETLTHTKCSDVIGEGGCCYYPNTLINHASVLMHMYYAEKGRNWWNCDFKGTGLTAITDPSKLPC